MSKKGTVRADKKLRNKKKRTALVICRNRQHFWTTQAQFWQWVRDGVAVKLNDYPLTGALVHEHQQSMVVLNNTVLNLSCPNHLNEALRSRRLGLPSR